VKEIKTVKNKKDEDALLLELRALQREVRAMCETLRKALQTRASKAAQTHVKPPAAKPVPADQLVTGFICMARVAHGSTTILRKVVISGKAYRKDGSIGYVAHRLEGGLKNRFRKLMAKPAEHFFPLTGE
jgi:hypothetical protein